MYIYVDLYVYIDHFAVYLKHNIANQLYPNKNLKTCGFCI